jgi:hypothetical protein
MAMTDYLEDKLLDHVLRNTPYTPPTSVNLAFFTEAPTDAGGGVEVVGGGYAAQPVTYGAPVTGSSSNTAVVNYTNLPACTVVAVGLKDESGNILFYEVLANPVTYTAGQNISVPVGDIITGLD